MKKVGINFLYYRGREIKVQASRNYKKQEVREHHVISFIPKIKCTYPFFPCNLSSGTTVDQNRDSADLEDIAILPLLNDCGKIDPNVTL